MDSESAENGHNGRHDDHGSHHAIMAEDFKKRFYVSTALTIPILFLSPMFRQLIGLGETFTFDGDVYVLLGLSTVVFVYGCKPFLKGVVDELGDLSPGMMTLIGLAISTAYVYSAAVAPPAVRVEYARRLRIKQALR